MITVNKQAHNWTDDEIIGWAKGEVVAGEATDEAVAAEAAKRINMESTNIDEIKAAVLDSVADEEPAPAEEPPAEEPVAEEPAPVTEPAAEEEVVTEQPKEETVVGASSTTKSAISENIAAYVTMMMPGHSHREGEGENAQRSLYRTFEMILRLNAQDFTRNFSDLLAVVQEHRETVFHESRAFRYMATIPLPTNERRNFERFMHLIITTCNPATRGASVKQVDLDAVMEGFKNEDFHQRIVGFYTSM